MKKTNRGFTLIELLVVIAIIGILAGVVLTNLSSARNKAKDAAVKSALAGVRTTMEDYASTNGNYGALTAACIGGAFDGTTAQKSNIASNGGTIDCGFSGTSAWLMLSTLPSAPTTSAWCVDSSGASKATTSVSVSDTTISC